MNRSRDIVKRLIHADTEPVEFLIALTCTLYGVTLLTPGNTFDLPPYRVMAQFAPEELFGIISPALGIATFASLFLGGKVARMLMMLACVIILLTTATFYIIVNMNSMGNTFLVETLASMWCFIRLSMR